MVQQKHEVDVLQLWQTFSKDRNLRILSCFCDGISGSDCTIQQQSCRKVTALYLYKWSQLTIYITLSSMHMYLYVYTLKQNGINMYAK